LAIEAMKGGFGAYFIAAQELVSDLGLASREGRFAKRLQIYLRPKVLVIDEMGYLPLDALGATVLFQLISARYERDGESEARGRSPGFSSPATRATANGEAFSAIPSGPLPFWIDGSITLRRSTSEAKAIGSKNGRKPVC
jgi:hypothetical protein